MQAGLGWLTYKQANVSGMFLKSTTNEKDKCRIKKIGTILITLNQALNEKCIELKKAKKELNLFKSKIRYYTLAKC